MDVAESGLFGLYFVLQ